MSEGCKETLCTNCQHCPDCSFKGTYLTVVEAIDQLTITTEEGIENVKVSDMYWVKPIRPVCEYYLEKNKVMFR